MKRGKIYIGTSGWSYWDWKGTFYPKNLKSTEYLPFYAKSYNTSEINSSFYHLPRLKTVEGWVEKVPKGFMFCPKISKYLTHIKRLKEPEEPLQRFFEVFKPMQKLMGPVLVQLPPSLKFDYDVAEHFYKELKKNYKQYDFAMEVRHLSWLDEASISLMTKYNMAFVISQSGVGFPYAEIVTSENVYVRFHGPEKLYASLYSDEMMQDYAHKFAAWKKEGHTVWAYFNNDWFGYGLKNANTLKQMLGIK